MPIKEASRGLRVSTEISFYRFPVDTVEKRLRAERETGSVVFLARAPLRFSAERAPLGDRFSLFESHLSHSATAQSQIFWEADFFGPTW